MGNHVLHFGDSIMPYRFVVCVKAKVTKGLENKIIFS